MASSSNSNSPLEALRGDAGSIFELVFEIGTAGQWGDLLRAPLECAVLRGDEGMVQKLVGAGASMGGSVHAAVKSGRAQMMDYLLAHGGSIMDRDASGDFPLHTAAQIGRPEFAYSLLLRGATINAVNQSTAIDSDHSTALFCAAKHGHLSVLELLMAAGADVDRRCRLERPLETAAEHGHADIVRALIAGGSDVNLPGIDGMTAIQSAVVGQKAEMIDVLVEAGANIDPKDVFGCTPLHTASLRDRGLDTTLALLRHGAEVNAVGNHIVRHQTPLHYAAHWAAGGEKGPGDAGKVVDILLRWGADETIVDDEGRTPLDLLEAKLDGSRSLQEVERVRKLLANAPADRTWRRRCFLVMYRAYPDRVQVRQDEGQSDTGMARNTRSRARLARAEACASVSSGTAGVGTLGEGIDDDFGRVAARVVGLEEEDIFRTIVGYL